jgi:hypothetical protein
LVKYARDVGVTPHMCAIHRYGHNGSAWTGQALSILSKCSRTASALPLSPLIRLIGIEEYRHPVKWLIDP